GTLGDYCNGWTGSGRYTFGEAHAGALGWTNANLGWYAQCTDGGRLLCVMKVRTVQVSPPPAPAGSKLVFLTDSTYQPAPNTSPDAHCTDELGKASKALVWSTMRGMSGALTLNTIYVRPDGVVVGTGEDIVHKTIQSGIWQHLHGAY